MYTAHPLRGYPEWIAPSARDAPFALRIPAAEPQFLRARKARTELQLLMERSVPIRGMHLLLLLCSQAAFHYFDEAFKNSVGSAKGGKERGGYGGHVMRSSAYTRAALSPGKALLAAGLGLAVFAGIRSFAGSDD